MHRGPIALAIALLLVPAVHAAQTSLFTLFKSVTVTPSSDFSEGGFVRIGYIPAKDRIVVTFATKTAACAVNENYMAYAYEEYTTDMSETAHGVISNCHVFSDNGAGFDGNDFYLALMEPPASGPPDGWLLGKYDALTWTLLVSQFHSFPKGQEVADPMVVVVNGQLDVSSDYTVGSTTPPGPTASYATWHAFFSTSDLSLITQRVFTNPPHCNLSSLVTANGVINFVTPTAIVGDMIVMRFYSSWTPIDWMTVKKHASAPEGVAFDGGRFYVSYLDGTSCQFPCGNAHLAAFDSNWKLIDDVAVTSFTSSEGKVANRPSLALHNGRIYVCWDGDREDKPAIGDGGRPQAYVKVYDISTASVCTSFTISPTSASATPARWVAR